jgi:Stress responsive A/B Barrel Domain
MPIAHVITFTFRPHTSRDVIAKLGPALDDLAQQSNTIFYHHGADLGIREGNADYAVVALFENQDAFTAYMTSPLHDRINRENIRPFLQTRSAVQFQCDASAPPR